MNAKLLILAIAAFVAVTTTASADTIVVDWSGGGDHLVIQDALDAASDGDTVLVMPGTYTGTGNIYIDFGGTDCVLMSSGGAQSVTIDCASAGRALTFQSGETSACVVEGFTITNGLQYYGGAMYFIHSAPTIRDCVMTGNTASILGGAVICTSVSSPTFTGCTFSNNEAILGGAAYCEYDISPSFEDCDFFGNTATDGGGAVWVGDNGSSPTFVGCSFEWNSVTGDFMDGGAMYITNGSSPTFFDCSFTDNSAPGRGGAIESDECSPVFTVCTFARNSADGGGAVDMYGSSSASFDRCWFAYNTVTYEGGAVYSSGGSVPTFTECMIIENTAGYSGGAMYFNDLSTPELTGCTFYANSAPEGSGIWCDDNFTLTNSIIAFGVSGEAVYCDGDPPYPSCSDIYGNAGGDWIGCLSGLDLVDNNLSADPLFCDAPSGDLSLDVASPCAAANAPACGLIGAGDVDCDSPVKAESWGAIKAMYR